MATDVGLTARAEFGDTMNILVTGANGQLGTELRNVTGPGGYGVVLKCAGHEKEMSGGFARTTNNRMELLAVIKGLEAIKWRNAEVEVYSDSSYVVKAVNEGWLLNWERKGWKKVKNPDLWKRFLNVYRMHRVAFHWLKGHNGHPGS